MVRRRKSFGFGPLPPHPPFFTAWEWDYVVQKRALGWPDAHIARQLGCTVELIRRGTVIVADYEKIQASLEPLPFNGRIECITKSERARRDHEARQVKVWRPKEDADNDK